MSATYNPFVKRLQIYIEPELDGALAVEAARTGRSKASLIRQYVAERLVAAEADPLDVIIGAYDEDPGSIDDVVYGR
jgi:hypothetical protein